MTDSKQRFSNRVADYVAGRPTYPEALRDVLAERIGFDATWVAADIGAGTGISSKRFLDFGNRVIAVEPNEPMRLAAMEWLGGDANYQSIAAPAEATTLPDASVDLVLAAQAFHWFDPPAFARECLRILMPCGRAMLMWNNVQTEATPFAIAYQSIVKEYALDLHNVAGKWKLGDDAARNWYTPDTFIELDLPNDQNYTRDTLAARVASSSYMPHRGHPRFDDMIASLYRLFDEWQQDGVVTLPHLTRVYLGRPREVA